MSSAEGLPAGLREDGPRVVAVGGGHGLAASLRSIRRYASKVTAVVTVADDGGSSGRLRASHDVPAPGDMRLCLHALAAEPGSVWARTVEHRFDNGELEGHALGNLLMVALAEHAGDLVTASRALGHLVGAVGDVLPATIAPVRLTARVRPNGPGPFTAERVVEGQVAIATTAPVCEVAVVPPDPPAPPEAAAAIAEADQIVLGPGSLFTSVLAAAVVPSVNRALQKASGRRVWVANLREQRQETAGFTLADHLDALERHGVTVDTVVLDHRTELAAGDLGRWPGLDLATATIRHPQRPVHDPELLAPVLAGLV